MVSVQANANAANEHLQPHEEIPCMPHSEYAILIIWHVWSSVSADLPLLLATWFAKLTGATSWALSSLRIGELLLSRQVKLDIVA